MLNIEGKSYRDSIKIIVWAEHALAPVGREGETQQVMSEIFQYGKREMKPEAEGKG